MALLRPDGANTLVLLIRCSRDLDSGEEGLSFDELIIVISTNRFSVSTMQGFSLDPA